MNKQEFLAMSLPYGLMLFQEDLSGGRIFPLLGINQMHGYGIFTGDVGDYNWSYFEGFKPILRPLSDLTKEIIHNGNTFIPIVEICKLSETVIKVLRLKSKTMICGFDFVNDEGEVLRFGYHYNSHHFQLSDANSSFIVNETILYQLEMFQKLIEWHFDIAGLIEKGEAIDVNTLEVNPYER